jgi:alkylation response protein AidB-like acyl-CoA dehydrogenase
MIEFGSEQQKRKLLPGLLDGSTYMSMGITEPDHGSDATHMETTARREGDDWIINGTKAWNSAANWSDTNMVFARTSGKPGDAKGITAFLVPNQPHPAAGMVVEELLWTFVMPTDHATVSFNGVRVRSADVLGEVGEGLKIMSRFFNENRIRQAAAKPLASNQAIQFQLVELQTQCEMLRALLHKTAWLMDRDGAMSQTDKVSMLNYWANRLCGEAADRAIQIHGGLGYSRHKPFEHIYRHYRRYRITEGTEEIQMRRVAGYLFGFMKLDTAAEA